MIHYDCRHYIGKKPCKFKKLCENCSHYDALKFKILIIKLGALGDLLRTTPILPALKRTYPNSEITWLTQSNCLPLLENISEIDRVWVTDQNAGIKVTAEHFDLMVNFDKETPAVELATISKAEIKKGFGLSQMGKLVALNQGSLYSLKLGINDELKFKVNKKTYQELTYEMADLDIPEKPPHYQLTLRADEIEIASKWFYKQRKTTKGKFILGINAGCGKIFATKKWHPERYLELITKLYKTKKTIPILFGGKDEVELNNYLEKGLKKKKVPVLRPGENLELRNFAAFISQCNGVIAGDTLAMHLGLALGVKTVIVFTSTCPQEIELYNLGATIIGKAECAPCYLSKCKQKSQLCADGISVKDFYDAVVNHMELR